MEKRVQPPTVGADRAKDREVEQEEGGDPGRGDLRGVRGRERKGKGGPPSNPICPGVLSSKERYHAFRRAGVCVRCCDRKKPLRRNKDGKPGIWCRDCYNRTLEINALHKRKMRTKAKCKGMCLACFKRKAIEGQTRCGACADYNIERLETRRADLVSRRRCYECGEPLLDRFKACASCRAKHALQKRKKKFKKAG